MEGAVSWADSIQAIHSWRPILQSTKLLNQLEKILMTCHFFLLEVHVSILQIIIYIGLFESERLVVLIMVYI